MRKQLLHSSLVILLTVFLFGDVLHAQQEPAADPVPSEQELTGGCPMPPPPPPRGRHPHGAPAREGHLPPPIRHYFMKLQQEDPEEYERLLQLRMENREQFMKEISERMPRQKNPAEERFRQLDQQCWELAEQLRSNPPPENAEELQAQLQAMVAEAVDSMIAQTKERLEEIQSRLQQMEALRDRIVQQRLDFYMQAPLHHPNYGNGPDRRKGPPPPPPAE